MSDQNTQNQYGGQPPQSPGSSWAPAPPTPPASRHPRRSGITAGVILIAIGAVFLAGQLIPGVAWWNLWPLLVVLAGVIQMFTPDHRDSWTAYRLLDGFGTVLVGVVLLGNTLGVVSWSVWWAFIALWPLLLIALGISVLGRGLHQMWLRGAATLLVWATLALAVAASLTGVAGLTPIQPWTHVYSGQPYTFTEPVGTALGATLAFKGGAGDIRIHGGDELIGASGTTAFGKPDIAVTRSANAADVAVTLGSSDRTVVAPGLATGEADIALSRTVLWDATLETGASQLDADLSDLSVKHLALKTGVSEATIKLGDVPLAANSTDVEVKSGLSDVTILVPADAAVRVDTHNGLTTTNLDDRFVAQSPGLWQTPGFESAARRINISIESGISSVSVRTY